MPEIKRDRRYAAGDDVVAREIEGEMILVPLTGGIGSAEGHLYSLNETGRSIWRRLDGSASLSEVVRALAEEYDAPAADIQIDVEGLMRELLSRGMVKEIPD
jgi:hypothetical protein